MRGLKKERWENLAVVWKNESPEWPTWFLTTVINHNASDDPSAPKYVTHSELMDSIFLRDRFIKADSKEEAMLKYAAAGGSGKIWSLADEYPVPGLSYAAQHLHQYRLVEETAI